MHMASNLNLINDSSLPTLNRQDILINWINTIKQPKCLLLSSLSQLRDGKVFIEILKNFLIKQGMDENELSVDSRLSPFERIKLVICSLIELIDDEDRERVIEIDKRCLNSYSDDLFLIQFGFLLKELYEKASAKESLVYLNTRSDEDFLECSRDFNGKSSFLDPNRNKKANTIEHSQLKPQIERNAPSSAVTAKKKPNNIINIITDYIEDTLHEDHGDNGRSDLHKEGEGQEEHKRVNLNKIFSVMSLRNPPTLKTQETNSANHQVYSSRSILTHNAKVKHHRYTRQEKGDINMHIGLEVTSKIPKNNLQANSLSQALLQQRTFLYPTKPILDISLSSIVKYKNTLLNYNEDHEGKDIDHSEQMDEKENDTAKANTSNDSLSASLLNIIGTTDNKKPQLPQRPTKLEHHRLNRKPDYQGIVKWLIGLRLIKDKQSIPLKAKSGVLLCDIINRCESKHETIKGVIRSPFTPKQAILNINKALDYSKKINLRSDCLWSSEQIQKGNEDIIFSLLNDLYLHYSKGLGRAKSLSHLINPSHFNNKRKSDDTATIELNDSIFSENNQQYANQPMTQMSSLSNILKTAKNQDISHHTSVTTSNICTIANCLGVNTSSIKPKEEKLLKTRLTKPHHAHSREMRNMSYKTDKSNYNINNSIKLPQCFIIFKKANIHQIKQHITKVCITKPHKDKR